MLEVPQRHKTIEVPQRHKTIEVPQRHKTIEVPQRHKPGAVYVIYSYHLTGGTTNLWSEADGW